MTEAVLVTHFAAKEEAVVKADSLPLTVGLVQVTPLPGTVVLGQVGLLPRAAEVERFGALAMQPVAVAQAELPLLAAELVQAWLLPLAVGLV